MTANLDLGDTHIILAECDARGVLRNQAAYILATAKWETAHTIKPIGELGGDAYLRGKEYYPHYGRGYVQLTWRDNYQRAGDEVGADLIGNPELALDPHIAAEILVAGMLEGWFTGKKLGDYVTLQRSDFVGARRVVNGVDRKHEIAAIAREYDAALLAEGYGVDPSPTAAAKPKAEPAQEKTTMLPIGVGGLAARYVLIAAAGAFASNIGWMTYNESANMLTIDLNRFDLDAMLGAAITGGGAIWWRKIAKSLGGKT